MSTRPDSPRVPKKNEEKPVDDPNKSPGPFDVRTVKSLVSLMTQHDLSEIDLRDGNQRLRLRRGGYQAAAAVPVQMPIAVSASPAPAAQTSSPKTETAAPATGKKLLEIKSPTPGTFYSSAKPGEPPFVKTGAKVSPETVVCLIEAMKIFNEIQAECSGVIVEVVVENQQPVEYGQVLFRVDPAG